MTSGIFVGEGYKAVSKLFEIHHSTVRTVYKWKAFKTVDNLPRSWHPSEFNQM